MAYINRESEYFCQKMARFDGLMISGIRACPFFFEDFNSGASVATGKVSGNIVKFDFALDSITPFILHRYSQDLQKVYICLSNRYKIYIKDMKGKLTRVIHRDHQCIKLTDEHRKEIVDRIFFRQPEHIRKIVGENLPEESGAVFGLTCLPRGYVGVQDHRVMGP